MSTRPREQSLVLAVDQGTTNTKAVLVTQRGDVVGVGSAPVGVSTPRTGWVEQDANRIWESVVIAVRQAWTAHPRSRSSSSDGVVPALAGVALSTQRESVVAWRASTGEPIGPVIGWQDRRTAAWCANTIGARERAIVHERTGLRVDAMFSAPKLRWLLDHLPPDVPADDMRVGTIDAWLIWRLTGGLRHVCEAGNASRTLLYDVSSFDWSDELLEVFGVPRALLPLPLASVADFGTCHGVPVIPDGTPIVAVLADSHAALYGHGCTEIGTAKATYGTGSSVMTPVAERSTAGSAVPTTLAWLVDGTPTYALEGNILSSGATLDWAAQMLTGGDVAELVRLAGSVADSAGVTLVPAFTGLGAPYWDREANALISGMTPDASRAHLARAAVDAVAHQVCDVVDIIEATTGRLRIFRADGGATAADLLMQVQADLMDGTVDIADVAEVSALGAARLAWSALDRGDAWQLVTASRRFVGRQMSDDARRRRRQRWAGEVARARFAPTITSTTSPQESR